MLTLWKKIAENPQSPEVPELLKQIETQAKTSQAKTVITFGTSGWRDVIGEGFTFRNVRIAVQSIIEMMKTPVYLEETGLPSFEAVQQQGILVGRDNRFLGESFVRIAAEVLAANGIRAFCIPGSAITPDLSMTVKQKGFAGSINFTPSHNPFEYAGLKFNPADGGTADPKLTQVIEKKAVALMDAPVIPSFDPVTHESLITSFESRPVYVSAVQTSGVVDIDFIRRAFDSKTLTFIVDNVHGASIGYLESVLTGLTFPTLRSSFDILFGGVKPEPSAENLQLLFSEMKKYHTPLKLGVILDPDGDRVRFMDGEMDIDMNGFGAIAFHYLVTQRGFSGGIAKSVATSNLVNHIAEKLGHPIFETAVGFKNFRPYLKTGQAACAFEESDGISLQRHTLEKDGIIGALLALEITLRTGKSLGDYLRKLHAEYGAFYPKRFAAPISPEQKQRMQETLSVYKVGDSIGGLTISHVITVDGFKFVFCDGSWLMIRPSGTEPKVRIYVEAREPENAEKLFELAKGLMG